MEQPNLNYIDELAGNDNVFRSKLIETIKKELPGEVAFYKENLLNNHLKTAAGGVHKLKHKIAVLGLEKSYIQAEKFEAELLEGNTNAAAEFENILNCLLDFTASL